jgi:class 3 adenylate cyclase
VLVDDDDIVGDGVNIARGLRASASRGAFSLRTAVDHVRGRVDAHFIDLGERSLKNIARPVRVYAVRPSPLEPHRS